MKKRISILLVTIVLLITSLSVVLMACNSNTVTFDSNGGSEVESVKGTVKKEPIPTMSGYTFEGWFEKKGLTGKRVVFPYTPKENVTLYAKWTDIAEQEKMQAIDTVANALMSAIDFDITKKFGATVGLSLGSLGLTANAILNPEAPNDTRIGLDIQWNSESQITLYVDDENAYAVTDSAKKRFKNVGVGELLEGLDWSEASIVNSITGLLGMAFHMMFDKGVVTVEGDNYTLVGGEDVIEMITSLIGADIPAEVASMLEGVSIKITATVTDGVFMSGGIELIKSDFNLGAGISALKIGNDYTPALNVPAKNDATFDETNLLNFTLKGSATLVDKVDFVKSDAARFDYEIRVDYDIVTALKSAFASGKFDASQLFTTEDAKIYIDLFHKCSSSCTAFCETKMGESRGSFLTVAYSPEDFGSNNLNIAINPRYLLPDGFIDSLIDLGGIDIIDMFGEYLGLNIDPTALLTNSNTNIAEASTVSGNININTITTVIDIVTDIVDFAGKVSLTEADGLRIGVNELLEILDIDIADGMNLAGLMKPFFGDAALLDIKVDEAIYGDPTTQEFNVYENFMYVDKSIGDYKSFVKGGSEAGNDFTIVKNIDWKRGADKNVIISAGDDLKTHDVDGKPLLLSDVEMEALLNNGGISYDYERVDTVKGSSSAQILSVYGLDYTIKDKPQDITIVTAMADGGALAGLLGAVSRLMPDMNLNIPGAVIHTTVTITSTEFIGLEQAEDAPNRLDPNKEYRYGEKLNPYFTAKIKYTNGETKEKSVMPNDVGSLFTNYSNPENATVAFFKDCELKYDAFGLIFTKEVKALDGQLVNDKPIEVKLDKGASYTFGNNPKVDYINENSETKSVYVRGNEASMSVLADEKVAVEKHYTQGFFGQQFAGYKVTFNEGGTYNVSVVMNPAFTFEYIFIVAGEDKIVLPGYSASANIVDKTITVDVMRTEQTGKGLNATVKVEATIGGEERVLTADEYEIQDMEGKTIANMFIDDFLVKPYQFKILIKSELEITGNITVSLLAKDFKDTVICTAITSAE